MTKFNEVAYLYEKKIERDFNLTIVLDNDSRTRTLKFTKHNSNEGIH